MLDPQNEFTVYRKDRETNTCGGGVCILLSNCFDVIQVDILAVFKNIECICIDILNFVNPLRLFVIYRPGGNSQSDLSIMKEITLCLDQFCNVDKTSIVFGDANCPNIDWLNGVAKCEPIQQMFHNCVCELGFTQSVDEPTRGANILDIVLCNDPLLISDVVVMQPFSNSDHCSVVCTLNTFCVVHNVPPTSRINQKFSVKDEKVTEFYLWSKANWEQIEIFVSTVDWDGVFLNCDNAEQYWTKFYDVICTAVEYFVPCRKHTSKIKKLSKKKSATRVFYPKRIKKLLKHKASMWRKFKISRTKYRKQMYNRAANTCKDYLNQHAKSVEHKLLNCANLAKFYKFVNSKLSSKCGIGPLQNDIGKFLLNDIEKANLLNNYFASVCIVDNEVLPPFEVNLSINHETLEHVTFTHCSTYKHLSKLKCTFSAGPDGIPPIFYKKLARCLTGPISKLNQLIFDSGALPAVWKTALVTPIFKKGRSSIVANYRPISLTCVACKIFEQSLKTTILSYMLNSELLHPSQHGFISKHSTCTNLLEALNDWTINIKNGNCTRVAFVDFSRAFDTVSHSKLLHKLSSYGIQGKLLSIVQSFLKDRTQKVFINNVSSDSQKVISGVPQGSVLGPLLFVTYINDLSSIFSNNVISNLFADDAKLYSEIKCENDITDFQNNLDCLSEWAAKWQLYISTTKCSTLDIGSAKKTDLLPCNTLDKVILDKSKEKIDLGVKLDKSLTFSMHICEIVSRAKQRTFLLFRSFTTRNVKYLLLGFKSYILPVLNYCSSIWTPHMIGDIDALESVQRMFTKKLPGYDKMSYKARLFKLKLPSLELRRLRADLLLCYKIFHGDVCGPPERYGLKLSCQIKGTRGHSLKLCADHSRVDTRLHFFSTRIVKPWNALPADIVHSLSAQNFKRHLININLNKFLILKYNEDQCNF